MNSALEPAHEPGPVTAEAPSNIAFIKYWGARDLERDVEGPVPFNRSLSMTLDACRSICSASPLPEGSDDEIHWVQEPAAGRSARRRGSAAGLRRAHEAPPGPVAGMVAADGGALRGRIPDRDGQHLPVGRRDRLVGLRFHRA